MLPTYTVRVFLTELMLGYPTITVDGLIEDGKDAGKLALYPDAEGKATVNVKDAEKYKSLSYQWQKYNGSEWVNLPAYKTNELTITNASAADKGTYRCRVNVIYFDETSQKEFSISAYSKAFETAYSKRTPEGILTVAAQNYGEKLDKKGIHAELELHSANAGNITAPTGNVTFTIEGKDYENTKTSSWCRIRRRSLLRQVTVRRRISIIPRLLWTFPDSRKEPTL